MLPQTEQPIIKQPLRINYDLTIGWTLFPTKDITGNDREVFETGTKLAKFLREQKIGKEVSNISWLIRQYKAIAIDY